MNEVSYFNFINYTWNYMIETKFHWWFDFWKIKKYIHINIYRDNKIRNTYLMQNWKI